MPDFIVYTLIGIGFILVFILAAALINALVLDPVKDCDLYKDEGCSHVDGMLCDFPKCDMYKEYLEQKST